MVSLLTWCYKKVLRLVVLPTIVPNGGAYFMYYSQPLGRFPSLSLNIRLSEVRKGLVSLSTLLSARR